jgi:hypothetical protein
MSDASGGFFDVFRRFFDDLSAHECAKAKEEGLACRVAPSFGASGDTFEKWSKFYEFWDNFLTKCDECARSCAAVTSLWQTVILMVG